MTDNVEKTPAVTAPEIPLSSGTASTSGSKKESPKATAPKNKTNREESPKKASSFIAVVALLLVILSLVAIGGVAWKGFELSQQVSSLGQDIRNSSDFKVKFDQKLSNVERQARQHNKQLQQNAERIANLPGADRNDWLIAEAEYLLRLANQRLSLENDVKGSLAILSAADQVLAEAGSTLLLPVRRLVAEEMQTLKAIPTVDLTGAIVRLQALQDQIKQLEWMPRTLPTSKVDVEETVAETVEDPFQKFLTKAWAGIGAFVRIREHEKALPAPLTPDQHYYLQQNMNLMLEQAQVALVRQQSDLYKQSLARTQQWMDQFVIAESVHTTAVKNTLKELMAWDVSPQQADISGSLNTLRDLLDQQRRNSVINAKSQPTQ